MYELQRAESIDCGIKCTNKVPLKAQHYTVKCTYIMVLVLKPDHIPQRLGGMP